MECATIFSFRRVVNSYFLYFPAVFDVCVSAEQGPDSRVHFPPHFAKLLAPSKHLQGHSGCVNRLAWNEDGTMLASGSDDRKVMLWSYPDADKDPVCIDTRHELNIFGVEFLPCTGSSMVISAAFDRTVQLHRLDRTSVPKAGPWRSLNGGSAPIATQGVKCHTQVFTNHSESVKDVSVEKGNPHCFWSASVDGRVHQFDLRAANMTEPDAPNMLIQAPQYGGHGGYRLEFNSLDINNVRPWLMATACSDHLVRVYDRRRLSLRDPSASAASVSLLELCPLHLHLPGQHAERAYTTCARFSNRGDRLVTTYHSEHAYTFDVQGASRPPEMSFCATRPNVSALEAAARDNDTGGATGPPGAPNATLLDQGAAEMRTQANEAVMQDRWDEALQLYNKLILQVPWLAHSWAARAIVLLHRGWKGDAIWALRDADTCVALNPRWHKAYETRVRCLRVLGQIRTAMTELSLLMEEFPRKADSRTLQTLRDKLEKELAAQTARRNVGHTQQHTPFASSSQNPSDPRTKAAAEECSPDAHVCAPHAPCRSFRAYLRSLQPHSDTADAASDDAEYFEPPSSRIPSNADSNAPCSHNKDVELDGLWDGDGHRNGASAQQPAPACDRAAAARAAAGLPASDTTAQAGHSHSMPCMYTELDESDCMDDGLSEGPSGTVRWVRNAIQRSWGAWLAGETSPGAWQMCRDQACTAADAVFLDALRGCGHGDSGAAAAADAHMTCSCAGLSMTGSSGGACCDNPLRGPSTSNAAFESGSNSRHHLSSQPLDCDDMDHPQAQGRRGAPLRGCGNNNGDAGGAVGAAAGVCESHAHVYVQNSLEEYQNEISAPLNGQHAHLPEGRGVASLAAEADDALRRLGAVVHDDDGDRIDDDEEGEGEGESDEDDALGIDAHRAFDWTGERRGSPHWLPRQAAGPELLSYVYGHRFVGQCNILTHIKEATFVGPHDHIVACGSDHGNVFLFDSITGELLRVLAADQEVANCVQCHPTLPVLATSGLESVVKLWEVRPDDEATAVGSSQASMDQIVQENQQRLSATRIHLPADAELETLIQNPEMLRLVGMTSVRYGDGREVTCSQS